jgi:hypothetical protein
MLVKKNGKYYQVKFKHKKIQTGGGIQDYLMAYLVALSVLETRKLLKFLSAYARAKNREEKKKLFKEYKDVLFSIETLEDPVIGILLKGMSNSLSSSKKTDNGNNGDDSQSVISNLTDKVTGTVTTNVTKATKYTKDLFRKLFNLKETDEPQAVTGKLKSEYLTRQREQNTVGNDPALPEQFVSGQPNLTASGKRMGRLPNILSDVEQQQIQRKQNQRAQNKNLINQSFDPELDNLFNIDAGGTSEQIQKQPTQGTLLSQFVQKAPQQDKPKVEESPSKQKYAQFKSQRTQELKEEQPNLTAEQRKQIVSEQWNEYKGQSGQSGEGLKDFFNKSLSIAKNNIKNVTPKLLKAVRTILKYYIVYTIGEKMGIIKGLVKSYPDFNSILRNRELIFKMVSEIDDRNLIYNILDKIKNKNIEIYNYIRNNII